MKNYIPHNLNKSNAKDLAFQALVDNHPLTVKQLRSYIIKKWKKVSYQAVHKALHKLQEKNFIERTKRGYKITEFWIENAELFVKKAKINYSNEQELFDITMKKDGDVQKFKVKSLLEARNLHLHIKEKYVMPNMKKIPLEQRPVSVSQIYHPTTVFIDLFGYVKRLKSSGPHMIGYYLIKGNTNLDNLAIKFQRDNPNNQDFFKLGVRINGEKRIAVYGDFVFEYYYDKKLLDLQNQFYKKAESINDFNIHEFIEKVYLKETKIKVIVHKDRELAHYYKEKLLKEFHKK